jgi:hypothetical protein
VHELGLNDMASISAILRRAQANTFVVTDEGTTTLTSLTRSAVSDPHQAILLLNRWMNDGTWQTSGSSFRCLQDWIASNWKYEAERPAPARTVAIPRRWWQRVEFELDPEAAARKLLAAAALYGPDRVGGYAGDFAKHGMIEVHSVYLLKGAPIQEVKPLDEYCTLLPYREALRRMDSFMPFADPRWPPPHADNICALECRGFQRRSLHEANKAAYTSPLLREGPEHLALLLGLTWGAAFRVFGSCHGVPAPVAATLPSRNTRICGSWGDQPVELALQGYGPDPQRRPLATLELHDLATKFTTLPPPVQRRLTLAMRRLRDGLERTAIEDKVIDTCIALEALFVEEGEDWKQRGRISGRGSWYYADSEEERERTRKRLRELYDCRSRIVHGNILAPLTPQEESKRQAELYREAVEVLRTSIKCMVLEGRPGTWDDAKQEASIRHDPPRSTAEIRSVKSDSLSWSVEEQYEIDSTLEAVWKPTIENADEPPKDASVVMESGVTPDRVAIYRERGIPYIIAHPARLYVAHPKWPKNPTDPLDERTAYYCEQDVLKHARNWRDAVCRKRIVCFEVTTDAKLYHPRHRHQWPQPLQ